MFVIPTRIAREGSRQNSGGPSLPGVTLRIEFTPEAEAEINEAQVWHGRAGVGLGGVAADVHRHAGFRCRRDLLEESSRDLFRNVGLSAVAAHVRGNVAKNDDGRASFERHCGSTLGRIGLLANGAGHGFLLCRNSGSHNAGSGSYTVTMIVRFKSSASAATT